jgi:hypothetical protein
MLNQLSQDIILMVYSGYDRNKKLKERKEIFKELAHKHSD